MSLQVWLPLNGNLNNQGLSDIHLTTTATFSTPGKIGQSCLNSQIGWFAIPEMIGKKQMSFAYWVKLNSGTTTNWLDPFSWYSTDGSTNYRCRQEFYYYNSNGNTEAMTTGVWYYNTSNSGLTQRKIGQWYHYAFTIDYKTGITKFFINGQLWKTTTNANTSHYIKGDGNAFLLRESTLDCSINDFRLYDHCLSDKEIEEISKGLILHYKLDQNINVLNNCYNYPTFNTSSANGGWSHWGPSGHSGTYSQNTDKQFIYNKNNTYSHCVDNTASATGKYYLCYQSPAFEGGYRSLQCIVKEANGQPITESICVPGWNARNGGAPSNIWTRITSLGDGFYWCQVDGISQSGSDDLVSITVQPGYKIYISEAYLENNKEFCSDIFNQDNLTTIYDSSGYNNNGDIKGILKTSNNTARYNFSTIFDGDTAAIQTPNLTTMITDKNYTISCWTYKTQIGNKNYQTIYGGPSGFELEARSSSNTNPLFRIHNWGGGTTAYEFNKWYHFCFVHNDTESKLYINGELKITGSSANVPSGNYFIGSWNTSTSQNFDGNISDFRIYATALTAEQILELYNTSASIDKEGNIYTREVIE